MKSMFLSVVIICALAISALGGTFATWSDSETSEDNIIETASLDLKVNGQDDEPWGEGVGPKVCITHMIPCVWYGPFEVELWHGGQCDYPAKAFLHLKEFTCYNLPPKEGTGYPADKLGDPLPKLGDPNKCEPELVAEFGGKVNCAWTDGIGEEGDDCSMGSHVMMVVTDTLTPPYDPDPDREVDIRGKLYKWECIEYYLFDLMPCEPRTIYLWFHLQQDPEEDWGYNIIPNFGEEGYNEMHWTKFNDWPSWALMKDGVFFDIEFDLWLDTSEIEQPIPPTECDPWWPPID